MDLLHVFKQGDPVLIAAFLILVIMSLATWTVMIVRTIKLRRAKKPTPVLKTGFGARNLGKMPSALPAKTKMHQ